MLSNRFSRTVSEDEVICEAVGMPSRIDLSSNTEYIVYQTYLKWRHLDQSIIIENVKAIVQKMMVHLQNVRLYCIIVIVL